MIIALVQPDDPILHERMPEYTARPLLLDKLASAMFEVCGKGGLGLAAPQVGHRVRMFIMDPRYTNRGPTATVCINPAIVSRSKLAIGQSEGCLTRPGETRVVVRPVKILASWTTLAGKRYQTELYGLPGRVFQHETDHLNGITIFDKDPP